MMNGDPLPVLMVVADQQDFYYQESGETRPSAESAESAKDVAEESGQPAMPELRQIDADVTQILTTAGVDASEYSAIVFVGGWGSSMYQYDFPGDYGNAEILDGDYIANVTIGDPGHGVIVFVGGWGSSRCQYDFPSDYGNHYGDVELSNGWYLVSVKLGDADGAATSPTAKRDLPDCPDDPLRVDAGGSDGPGTAGRAGKFVTIHIIPREEGDALQYHEQSTQMSGTSTVEFQSRGVVLEVTPVL